MSRIDDLIAELAPAGVGYRTLGDIARLVRGNGMPKSDLTDEGVGAIHYGQIYTRYGVWATETLSFVAPEKAAKLTVADPGDIIVTNTSENVDDVGKAVAWLGAGSVVTGGHATVIKHGEDPKFLSYWFGSEEFSKQKRKLATGTKVIDVSAKQLATVRVPIPPLPIQREIVRVLDQFTRLEAELQLELEARRSQRIALANNYAVASRDKLGEGTRSDRVKLGSIARESVEPVKIQADQSYGTLGVKWSGGGVLVRDPRPGDSIKATTLYRARAGQLIYNRMFVVEGSFALVPDECEGAVVSGEFPLFELDLARVEPEWLLQHLCDPYMLKRIEGEVTGTERGSMKSRRRWKADQFVNFEISLPSMETQQEIVRVLRSSDALIRSLKDELSARRKQYEYYRDCLLTFKELAV
ncbi:restriction endonuclease subunit S [Arthrobacter frigidicola]|nr:restriction endonuclease subunit S [Arthrobacter frigidicola]